MNTLEHPEWTQHGWIKAEVAVHLRDIREFRPSLTHPNAPGVCLTLVDGEVSITHVQSGMRVTTLYGGWIPCPKAVRDMLAAACQVVDYTTLTAETAPKIPVEVKDALYRITHSIHDHEGCDACAWWVNSSLPKWIADAEEALERAKEKVDDAKITLGEAEEDLDAAMGELARLKLLAVELGL